MTAGRCLCGDHRFRLEGELFFMHHCHCSRCRKSQGSAFSTMVGAAPSGLEWVARGAEIRFPSSSAFSRISCGRCGSPLPMGGDGMPIFVPAGLLEGDFGQRPEMHLFAGDRASWVRIDDGLPAFEGFPPGMEDFEPLETRPPLDPPGGIRGSCLCGKIRFVLDGPSRLARHCHCLRCQRARGAACASNLITDAGHLRWTAGGDLVHRYRLPEARLFRQDFCGSCGSAVPVVEPERGFAIVPLGALDDPPDVVPSERIHVGSRVPWHPIGDDLPCHAERAPR
ncbi:MAG TPA: GFA family protein [Deltaproteobacteria bacterium]|nr:GFA family protein [Deltaproteobacteria bacterium]